MLIKYVRNYKREPIACVVGIGPNQIGWSVRNPKDEFNKKRAREIAIQRALVGSHAELPTRRELFYVKESDDYEKRPISEMVMEEISHMKEKCQRYYKEEPKSLLNWVFGK